MKVVLVYNDKSGSAMPLRELKRLFKQAGHSVEYSFGISQLRSRKLATLITDGATIAAVGGDGTLNSVARLLVGTQARLLPLPGGTFNHFVRDVLRSVDMQEILANAGTFKSKKLDVGMVNEELFLNNSNIGMYPFSLSERKRTKRYLGKWIAALLSASDQLILFRRHRLSIDGVKVRSPFVFVGNNKYDAEATIVPQRNRLDEGVVCLMVATSPSRLRLIRTLIEVLRGNIKQNTDFEISVKKKITIDTHRSSLPVSFDGEVKRLVPPLIYSSNARALNVLCPRDEK